jgi:hypothetical protein
MDIIFGNYNINQNNQFYPKFNGRRSGNTCRCPRES